MFSKSINTVLIIAVSISVITAVITMFIYTNYSSNKMALQLEENAMSQLAETTEKALDEYLQGASDLAFSLTLQSQSSVHYFRKMRMQVNVY